MLGVARNAIMAGWNGNPVFRPIVNVICSFIAKLYGWYNSHTQYEGYLYQFSSYNDWTYNGTGANTNHGLFTAVSTKISSYIFDGVAEGSDIFRVCSYVLDNQEIQNMIGHEYYGKVVLTKQLQDNNPVIQFYGDHENIFNLMSGAAIDYISPSLIQDKWITIAYGCYVKELNAFPDFNPIQTISGSNMYVRQHRLVIYDITAGSIILQIDNEEGMASEWAGVQQYWGGSEYFTKPSPGTPSAPTIELSLYMSDSSYSELGNVLATNPVFLWGNIVDPVENIVEVAGLSPMLNIKALQPMFATEAQTPDAFNGDDFYYYKKVDASSRLIPAPNILGTNYIRSYWGSDNPIYL